MINRNIWLKQLQNGWSRRSIVWLSGVRRVGKTTLARMLPDAVYLNCDLPSVHRTLEAPELFLDSRDPDRVLILDEVHRLDDPSRLLKIAADEYPHLRILATGSSTLAATRKFRDSLTGRKQAIHLCPVLWEECEDSFAVRDLDRRLLCGGLPEALLAAGKNPDFYNEWLDSFYARDILELFGIRNRRGFLSLFRLLLRQSGGQLDYSRLSSLSEQSRPTVKSHVEALQVAHAAFLLSPFHGGGKREIVSRPKCYAFDTGFVTFEKGWDIIREDDRGLLWEHLVLDALRFQHADKDIFYWQDKSRREVDFVVRHTRDRVDAIECKINPDRFNTVSVETFRSIYPHGENYIASPHLKSAYRIRRNNIVYTVCTVKELMRLQSSE
ncbi:MAG: ATP-binding protein [Gammaproteobacteria bacterium]|nr:ATP-binding protein [Gammaproteobacteria bacterium]